MELNEELFNKVYDFHGHVCLMSTAGVRLACSAMNAIGLNKSDTYLFAFYHARTCAADPIQLITGCTLANSNIIVTDERKHVLELVRQDNGVGVSVAFKPETLSRMRHCMDIKKASRETDDDKRVELEKKFDIEFSATLDFLRGADESEIIEVSPCEIDIAQYKRF